jgi:hypothetical protein
MGVNFTLQIVLIFILLIILQDISSNLYIKIWNFKGIEREFLRSKRNLMWNSMLVFTFDSCFYHWSFDSVPQQVSYMSDKDPGF